MKLHLPLLVGLLSACSNGVDNKKTTGKDTAIHQEVNAINWHETDSVEFIFYPDPKKQKEYKHLFIRDSIFLKTLAGNLESATVPSKQCAHNSKFYLFKNGEVFKTVYVSDSCNYLAYAVNSRQKFVIMNTAMKALIIEQVTQLANK